MEMRDYTDVRGWCKKCGTPAFEDTPWRVYCSKCDPMRPLDCIRIWPWDLAPEEFKKLSRHGGDEDWVIYVPETLRKADLVPAILWLPLNTDDDSIDWIKGFGWSDVHRLDNGGYVIITAHA